jgi:Flp pilus assembly protein TadG
MALCIPFLFIMLGGLIQYSMLLHVMATVDEYAREGGRFASRHHADPGFNNTALSSTTGYMYYMAGIATALDIPNSSVTTTWMNDYVYTPSSGSMGTWAGTSTPVCTSASSTGCVTPNPGDVIEVYVTVSLNKQLVFYGLVPGVPQTLNHTGWYRVLAQ